MKKNYEMVQFRRFDPTGLSWFDHLPPVVREAKMRSAEGQREMRPGGALIEFGYLWSMNGTQDTRLGESAVDSPEDVPSVGEEIRLNGLPFTVVRTEEEPQVAQAHVGEGTFEYHTVWVRVTGQEKATTPKAREVEWAEKACRVRDSMDDAQELAELQAAVEVLARDPFAEPSLPMETGGQWNTWITEFAFIEYTVTPERIVITALRFF